MKANQLDRNDVEIQNQLKKLEEKHRNHKETEANLWRKALGNAEPYVVQDTAEVNENFVASVTQGIMDFRADEKNEKMFLPNALSPSEIALIKSVIEDMDIEFVHLHTAPGKKNYVLRKI